MVRECIVCGKPYTSNIKNKLTCSPECSEIRRKQYTKKVNAEARAATRLRLGTKLCAVCGKEFEPNHPQKVCCSPECQIKRDREKVKSFRKTAAKKPKPRDMHKEAVEINAKAREMGMSWGQYMAYLKMEEERKCRELQRKMVR